MEEREPERATAQSTAIYEDKDGMSSGTGNAQWDDVETRHEGCCNLSRMEGLEPDAATRESTASKECKDGTSRLADKVRWDDDWRKSYEQLSADASKMDMETIRCELIFRDASQLLSSARARCLEPLVKARTSKPKNLMWNLVCLWAGASQWDPLMSK